MMKHWTLWQDARYGVRAMRKTPGLTGVALLSLALGIGATTAIFSVVYGVLIAPYPYAKPGEIWAPLIRDLKNPQQGGFSVHAMRDYIELKKLPAFAETMATHPENRLLTGGRSPENFTAVEVTANAFHFLDVPPILGRTIQPSDVAPGGHPQSIIVLSYKAWRRLFDQSPSALGKTLLLDAQPFTVVGVMPPRFGWWTDDGGWVILPESAQDTDWAAAIVRLRKGVSPKVGEEQLQALHLRLAKERPNDFPNGFTTSLQNYLDVTVASGEMKSSLRLLFGAVGFLLLIACANVANLQLARGTARDHELAVRMSLGAGRSRVFCQLLTESVVLSLAGGLLGILFAVTITRSVVALMPRFYVPNEARITVNLYVLLFSAGVAVLSGIVFGLAPSFKSSRPDVMRSLKEAGRTGSEGPASGRTRGALVTVEIALSVILLMGATLTIRGFVQLQALDPGFRSDNVLMIGLQTMPNRYSTYQQRIAFSESVLAAMSDLPGVDSVAVGNGGLPFGGPRSGYRIQGQAEEESARILLGLTSAKYPQTIGVPLRAGRELTEAEVARAEPVALINEAARKLWPAGTNPIGRQIHINLLEKSTAQFFVPEPARATVSIVGVLADTRNAGLRNPPAPAVYLPYTLLAPSARTLALRSRIKPESLLHAVRERMRRIDPDQPLAEPMTMQQILGSETEQPRFNMALFTFFGVLGLALAAAGLYSTLSYTVARRTQEIGIRMALGARPGNVLALVLTAGSRLVLAGLAAGVIGGLVLSRVLRSVVFLVPETDELALAAAVILLGGTAFFACLVPARRAAHLDPLAALRHE
jgi:putative ABC transport system permease protein